MKTNLSHIKTLMIAAILTLLTDPAFANRLQAAAGRGKAELFSTAEILSPCGIILGGILMATGFPNIGKFFAGAGAIAVVIVFGSTAFVETVRSIFGS